MERRWFQLTLALSVALFSTAQVARGVTCVGKPDGTTCDAGTDPPRALVCLGGTCGPCAADLSASPRYVDNGDGTITDRQTCLVWEKKDNAGGTHDLNNNYQWSSTGTAMDGSAFTVFLAGLNSAAFAGHQDWRLPASAGNGSTGQPAEIESIVDLTVPGCAVWADLVPCVPTAFNTNCGATGGIPDSSGNTGCTVDGAGATQECSCGPPLHDWAASTVSGSPSAAWLECYNVGILSAPSKTDYNLARAVRGGFLSPLCGNGVVDPGEQCDDGNTTSGDGCSATCQSELSPGGGLAKNDCVNEWLIEPVPAADHFGRPKHSLDCVDDDPLCDFGAAMGDGVCTFHVALCLNADEHRLACTATDVERIKLLLPNEIKPRDAVDTGNRDAFEGALSGIGGLIRGSCVNGGPMRGQFCAAPSDCDSTPGSGNGRCSGRFVGFSPPLTTANSCTSFANVQVPVRNAAGRLLPGHKVIEVSASPSKDPVSLRPRLADIDVLTLTCKPKP